MPGNALSLSALQNLSDEEVVRRHDEQAKTTVVAIDYFLSELNRRYQKRQADSMLRFTTLIAIMTLVVTTATIINVVIAVLN